MRESIGGAFLFNLVLIFLGVYVSILSFAVVYARAFNSKNHVITLLEQYEGYDRASAEINNYMATRSGGLTVTHNDCCNLYTKNYSAQSSDCTNSVRNIQGGCVFEFKDTATKTHYYVVTTFMRVDIPVISSLTKYWPISGETKVLYQRS